MKWNNNTVPYSFQGCHVIGYAEDHTGAWLIEHDTNLTTPYVLYRFDNDNAREQWQLTDTYHTAWGARRRAERDSSKVSA
jgi:hypothetical protein